MELTASLCIGLAFTIGWNGALLPEVYGAYKKEMNATFDRADIVSVVSGGKAGYANLKHLNIGSPGSDDSELGDAADLEELLAQGSNMLTTYWCMSVRPAEGKPKSSLATSIFLAAFLYLCVFGTSIMYFLRARRAQKVYQLSLDVHAD
ncbi:hypothetical protein BBJ28_00008330 [Nothophytophthora sp. Chile5]|nr:hypothetical protein BBJ28_00008330 [Nothophytophthora sp. Chile5]